MTVRLAAFLLTALHAGFAFASTERQLARIILAVDDSPAFAAAKGAGDPQAQAQLDAALRFYESFQDEKTFNALRALLARHPPASIASKAHVYLGLVLFNGNRSEEARQEFRRAMLADPAVELPFGASPKSRLAFGEARRDLAREVESSQLTAPEKTPGAAPAAATNRSGPGVSSETPSGRSHWLTWTVGGLGVVAGAVAVYGGVEVLTYNSLVTNARSGSPSASQVDGTNASFWRVGWIVAAAVGAASLTSAVLVW
jgi:hypothetical protein